MRRIEPSHGIGGYNRGCRCDTCREAKSVKRKLYQSEAAALNAKRRAKYARMKPEAKAAKLAYDRQNRARNRERHHLYDRKKRLKSFYHLTLEQYDALLVSQNSVCAICQKSTGMRYLAVDHDHTCCPTLKTCGKCIRGLLCQKCNGFLGRIQDDPTRLVAYLKKGGSDD